MLIQPVYDAIRDEEDRSPDRAQDAAGRHHGGKYAKRWKGQAGQAAVLFVPHTTAGIVLQVSGEGANAVGADIESALRRLVDEKWSWKHAEEGDRNPWAHVRSALTASSVTIPFEDGRLALGDLQTIFFCEFDGPRERKLYLTVT